MSTLPSPAVWSLSRHRASCALGGLVSTIDLARPQGGLEVAHPDAAGPDRLLGLELDPDCIRVDDWCRGRDVTAIYETAERGRLRATVMWRAAPAWLSTMPGVWCREAIVSAQTALLESVPRLGIAADVAAGTVMATEFHDGRLAFASPPGRRPHGWFVTWSDGRGLLFLVHPLDAGEMTAQRDGDRVRLAARLFPEAVEKGVLLRSRVVAAIGPAAGAAESDAWAERVARAFAASPPVLTT
ncbi:MAG: hypothetical protein WCR51_04975 [Planctomycetia bacterium]